MAKYHFLELLCFQLTIDKHIQLPYRVGFIASSTLHEGIENDVVQDLEMTGVSYNFSFSTL